MLGGLFGLLRRTPRSEPEPLRGRPRVRREKTYAADSGYVYHYTYEGYRSTGRDGSGDREFVFHCSSDRSTQFSITILAPAASLAAWESDNGRDLNAVERYAVVKMRLFEIFDEFERIAQDLRERLTPEQVARQVEALDL